jgi:hypothetical protein
MSEEWTWVDLPEDNGDPRLLEAVWALSEVSYKPPGWPHAHDISYFGGDYPDDCPRDHTEGVEGETTLVAFVRLAKAVLAVADRHASLKKAE